MSLTLEIQDLLREQLQVEVDDVNLNLMETGIIDSLSLVNLILAVEDSFNVSISLDSTDLNRFECISELESLILELKADINPTPGTEVGNGKSDH